MKLIISLLVILTVSLSCSQSEQHGMPKPIGYARVERQDSILLHEFDRFQFEYSSDAFLQETPTENNRQVWFNLDYPRFNATVFCTYSQISRSELRGYLSDNYQFVRNNLGDYITLKEFDYHNEVIGTRGSLYYFEGNLKSPYQFYLTDSTSYFLRGSLYYNQPVTTDSIRPVTKSLEGDLINLIETFENKSKK